MADEESRSGCHKFLGGLIVRAAQHVFAIEEIDGRLAERVEGALFAEPGHVFLGLGDGGAGRRVSKQFQDLLGGHLDQRVRREKLKRHFLIELHRQNQALPAQQYLLDRVELHFHEARAGDPNLLHVHQRLQCLE